MNETAPNPGSNEAIEKGCKCPILDNSHGQGAGWPSSDGNPAFWINEDCPIHNKQNQEGQNDQST
uniref:Uncharacterized protein n=1 Tax=viral metagenome TaxID=1070528 RepID=A0A6M3L2S9_9ZZZZ